MWKRWVRAVVRIGLADPRIRAVVKSELKAGQQGPARPAPATMGEFIDRFGVRHPLDPTLRDRLKPAWRTMVDPVAVARPPSDEVLRERASRGQRVVAEASALVAAVARVPLGGRMLEVGCHDGAVAFQLSRIPGADVVASDLARYYVVQRPGEPVESDTQEQHAVLATLREHARVAAGVEPGSVEFIEDDITSSGLAHGSFDAIVSFEVLEHVRDPLAAFAGMHRLLKPGGIGYHDYNPFFSLIGGHSLCTLDIPWGHARLDAADFERYVAEIRPDEAAQALRFYTESLNRMTLADLRAAVGSAGLELVAVVPWSDRGLVGRLSIDALGEVRRAYPTATVEDMLATFVAVVVRRPT